MADPTVLKHVQLAPRTHKRLRALQVEWECRSIDVTIQRLLDERRS